MSKEKVVLLSHYDLDGAGCSVLADHIWDVVDRKHQGYPKVRKSLGYLIGEHYQEIDTIVIADLKMELDDLRLAMFAFKNVIYYDHHESSEAFEVMKYREEAVRGDGNFEFHFDTGLCSTALMWIDGVKNKGAIRTPELDAFMNTVNAYDLWKEDNKRFQHGVMMNDMFWDLHMDKFRDRFKKGFSGFTENELNWHSTLEHEREHIIKNATVEEMESGSKVVVIRSSKAINFVSSYLDGDLYYIISPDFSMHNVSVRIKDIDINVNDQISELGIRYPKFVQSAGGHAAAGGITFKNNMSLNDIVDFLYDHDKEIRGEYCGAGT